MCSFAGQNAISTDELDIASSDSERDAHVLVVQFRDSSAFDRCVDH